MTSASNSTHPTPEVHRALARQLPKPCHPGGPGYADAKKLFNDAGIRGNLDVYAVALEDEAVWVQTASNKGVTQVSAARMLHGICKKTYDEDMGLSEPATAGEGKNTSYDNNDR